MRAHAHISRPEESRSIEELFELVGELARRRYQLAERHFGTLALNHTEGRLLVLLAKEGGAAGQDVVSGGLHVDRSNAGRSLQRLEDGGYVVRQQSATDRRAKWLRMTAKGRKAVKEIRRLGQQMAGELFGGLTEQEAGEAVRLLRKSTNV